MVTFEYQVEVEGRSLTDAISILEAFATTKLSRFLDADSISIFSEEIDVCDPSKWITNRRYCSFWESMMVIKNLETPMDEEKVERAVMVQIHRFLVHDLSAQYPGTVITLISPIPVRSTIVVQLSNVQRIMNQNDVIVFEDIFMHTLRSVLEEGSVDVSSVTVVSQIMKEVNISFSLLRTQVAGTRNAVSVRIDGTCRRCDSGLFHLLLRDAVESNTSDLECRLVEKSTSIHDMFTTTTTTRNYFEKASVTVLDEARMDENTPYLILFR